MSTPVQRHYTDEARSFFCESLNINSVINHQSNCPTARDVCLLSVCGGNDDEFTKTTLDWLHRAKMIQNVYFLLCGPSKCVDAHLCNIVPNIEKPQDDVAQRTRRKKQTIYSSPKIILKRQTNMPNEAQWKLLRPDIMLIGYHYLSERWCAKNCPNELLFRKPRKLSTTASVGAATSVGAAAEEAMEEDNFESSYVSSGDEEDDDSAEQAGDEDGAEADAELSEETTQQRKKKLYSSKIRRPTLRHTDVYRKAMLLECLSAVAKHRPQIVFIHNVSQPSQQCERRRKDYLSWEQIVEIAIAFGAETCYRVRPMGLELYGEKEESNENKDNEENDDDDDNETGGSQLSTKDAWCNGIFLERIDNQFESLSQLHYELAYYNKPEEISQILTALNWIFYDLPPPSQSLQQEILAQFLLGGDELFNSLIQKNIPKHQTQRRQRKRKSISVPVQVHFPHTFARALAYYTVAQVLTFSQMSSLFYEQ